jgi:hypothetical protein
MLSIAPSIGQRDIFARENNTSADRRNHDYSLHNRETAGTLLKEALLWTGRLAFYMLRMHPIAVLILFGLRDFLKRRCAPNMGLVFSINRT